MNGERRMEAGEQSADVSRSKRFPQYTKSIVSRFDCNYLLRLLYLDVGKLSARFTSVVT